MKTSNFNHMEEATSWWDVQQKGGFSFFSLLFDLPRCNLPNLSQAPAEEAAMIFGYWSPPFLPPHPQYFILCLCWSFACFPHSRFLKLNLRNEHKGGWVVLLFGNFSVSLEMEMCYYFCLGNEVPNTATAENISSLSGISIADTITFSINC